MALVKIPTKVRCPHRRPEGKACGQLYGEANSRNGPIRRYVCGVCKRIWTTQEFALFAKPATAPATPTPPDETQLSLLGE